MFKLEAYEKNGLTPHKCFQLLHVMDLLIFCQNFRTSVFLIIGSVPEFLGCLFLERVQWGKRLLFLGKKELLCSVSAICFSEFKTSIIVSVNSKATP